MILVINVKLILSIITDSLFFQRSCESVYYGNKSRGIEFIYIFKLYSVKTRIKRGDMSTSKRNINLSHVLMLGYLRNNFSPPSIYLVSVF